MVLPRQSGEQALFGSTDVMHEQMLYTEQGMTGSDGRRRTAFQPAIGLQSKARQHHGAIAALLAAIALIPCQALAMENGMRRMTEEDLSRISARGLYDRYFDKINRFASNGMGVEVLGDMAALLNPLSTLLDADINYKDVVFNPNSPWMVSDGNGSAYVRLPASIGEINIQNIRIAGTNGTSFGSVSIRGINFNGTTIKITKR